MSAAEVWVVDLGLSPARLGRCATLLSEDERERAERFMRPADRARYTASHAALRLVLARALAVQPKDIALAAGPSGKPELAGAAPDGLRFNLSHSGARALVGLAWGVEIGVDVEAIRPLPDALRIARMHFAHDEADALGALPREQIEAAFFGLWTRKEAVVKALVAGLSLPLDRFSVSVPPSAPRLLRTADPGPWTLADLSAGPDAAATVALRSADAIAVHRLQADWSDMIT